MPMVETANIIKDQDQSARVVFIGPCIAKKAEALGRGNGLSGRLRKGSRYADWPSVSAQ